MSKILEKAASMQMPKVEAGTRESLRQKDRFAAILFVKICKRMVGVFVFLICERGAVFRSTPLFV